MYKYMSRVLVVVLSCLLLSTSLSVVLAQTLSGTAYDYYGNQVSYDIPVGLSWDTKDHQYVESILRRVINVTDAQPSISVIPSNDVGNLMAVMGNRGEAIILYEPAFVQKVIDGDTSEWVLLNILAHEVGHHARFHVQQASFAGTTLITSERRNFELQADDFSGYLLCKLGATNDEIHLALAFMEREESTRTHPSKASRKSSLSTGWFRAKESDACNTAASPQPITPITVVSNKGKIRLTSVPSGASVFANGTYLGETPLDTELDAGSYQLKLILEGYDQLAATTKIEAGGQAAGKLRLARTNQAEITTITTPTQESPVVFVRENRDWTPIIRADEKGTRMAQVPAGNYTIGSENGDNDEKNGNIITFEKPYWIDELEVSREKYEECVRAGDCTAIGADPNEKSTAPNHPINNISWYNAAAYCDWRSARLPTEAEWEYAARGPSGWKYPWGERIDSSYARYGNWGLGTSEVGSYSKGASWVGAQDMAGNLWEWTSTLKRDYPYNANDGREIENNSFDISNSIVIRGGSFLDAALNLRAANRLADEPDVSNYFIGFRCARSSSEF